MQGNNVISFTIIIEPRPQLRHRSRSFQTKNGRIISQAYDDEKTKIDNKTLSALLMPHKPPVILSGPLELEVDAYLRIPKGFSKKKAAEALSGTLRPTGKPDLSNLVKKIEDRMSGWFYNDDRQIVSKVSRKWYGDPPRWEVTLRQLP
jgi:Holliday junction resolvase RusA-like endonuclease